MVLLWQQCQLTKMAMNIAPIINESLKITKTLVLSKCPFKSSALLTHNPCTRQTGLKVGSRAFCMFNNIALFYYFTSTWNSGTCGYQIREDWSILRVIQFLSTLRRKLEILIILKISFFLQSPERCTTQRKIHEKNTKYSHTRV